MEFYKVPGPDEEALSIWTEPEHGMNRSTAVTEAKSAGSAPAGVWAEAARWSRGAWLVLCVWRECETLP